jgi:hypothetical protein
VLGPVHVHFEGLSRGADVQAVRTGEAHSGQVLVGMGASLQMRTSSGGYQQPT